MKQKITAYPLQDAETVADFLGIPLQQFHSLCRAGRGPRAIELPSGESRYMIEEVHRWLFAHRRTIHDHGNGAEIVAFPGSGVRVRKFLNRKPIPMRARRRPRLKPTIRERALALLDHAHCLTDWEVSFLVDIKRYPRLSPKQEGVMRKIARKVEHHREVHDDAS